MKLPKLKTRDFLRELAELAAAQRAQIEAAVDGFAPGEDARRERVARARADYAFFKRTYFPHYCTQPNSLLHDYLDARLPAIADAREGCHEAIAAPRGEAKSTNVGLIFLIWCLVTGRKHFCCLIMDAFEVAATMLEAVKAELEANPRLAMDYPHATGAGRVWQAGVIVTPDNRKVQAFGAGKRMRGLRHGPHRPDLVICDDLENDENVRSPEQRDKLERWLQHTVLQLGANDATTDYLVIGTVLHYDSLLSRLLNNPLWHAKRFQAIVQWPARMDLWDRFEALLLNEGEAAALAYHAQHVAEMDADAVVSWPAARPLLRLMIIRARDGHGTFDSEYQNDPVSGEDAPFANAIVYWAGVDAHWVFYGACDPSLGKFGAGRDPSAIGVGGYNRKTGVLDVIEARIARRVPSKIIEDIIALQAQYHCVLWAFESVQFQEFLRQELVRVSAERGVPVPARPVSPHADKNLRIESLQPHMANGLIRLHPQQRTLIEQLRHWPKADHDDGPDMLQMLWAICHRAAAGAAGIRIGRPRRSESLLAGYAT
jgi:predicted phage terminase large subunit-like protein